MAAHVLCDIKCSSDCNMTTRQIPNTSPSTYLASL